MTYNRIACILLGVAGITLIVYKGNTGGDTAASLVLATFASIIFGFYTVLGKLKSEGISSITMICYSSIFGSLMYVPVLLLNDIPLFHIPEGTIIRILYTGVFVSWIA